MFQLEDEIQAQVASAARHSAQKAIAHARSQAAFDAVQAFVGWLQTFGLLAAGLLLFSRGYLLVGAVWAIVHLQGNASYLFEYFGQFITSMQKGLASGHRVLEILDQPTEKETIVSLLPPRQATAVLEDVSFSYAGGDRSTLQAISLVAEAGSLVALVGPSGSGKSTLLKLLIGFYLPDAGRLSVGGLLLNPESLQDIRRMIAYVPQDAYLFSGTIRENIAYGRPEAVESEIVEAARSANAHDFILEQPQGYETEVGEGGANLSGGQRQRIAIARALLRNAPLLLLDEATSAIDSESEGLVQEALDGLMRGRTTIAVAHRLSTVEHADTIYVLDKGTITEQGTHATLIASGGLYRHLYDLQFVRSTKDAASR
jgi:ATP-binding cassette subfamily B protein